MRPGFRIYFLQIITSQFSNQKPANIRNQTKFCNGAHQTIFDMKISCQSNPAFSQTSASADRMMRSPGFQPWAAVRDAKSLKFTPPFQGLDISTNRFPGLRPSDFTPGYKYFATRGFYAKSENPVRGDMFFCNFWVSQMFYFYEDTLPTAFF